MTPLPGSDMTVGAALLRPTRIYVRSMLAAFAIEGAPVHAAAHITGGGLLEKSPRALREDQRVRLDLSAVPSDPIFEAIAAQGVAKEEMWRTFNFGIGMLVYVKADRADEVAAVSQITASASCASARRQGRESSRPGRAPPRLR